MKAVFPCSILAAAIVLVGCATSSAPMSEPDPAAAQGVQPLASNDTITGSRIPARSTDRLLRTVGNADHRDAMDSSPKPLESH
nr:hypothetical protein [uncultured Massilia sp.]